MSKRPIDQTQIDRNHFEKILSDMIDSFINTHTMKKEILNIINEMLNQKNLELTRSFLS
jgi:hypothetical protein